MNGLENLITHVSRNAAQQIRRQDPDTCQFRTWEDIERILAKTHLAFLWPLIPEPKAAFQEHDPESVVSLPETIPSISDVSETTTRVTAVNWRGLFLENGRRTILEPSGALYNGEWNLERHKQLHKIYLDMAGKHVSINQIFLEWKIGANQERRHASTLTVEFSSSGTSSLSETDGHVNACLSSNITRLLWPENADGAAAKIVNHVLAVGNGQGNPSRGPTEDLPPILQKAADETFFAVLKSEFAFFEQFRGIFDPGTSTGPDMFTKFFFWLRSLAWLQFYCRDGLAGRFFYTARLPHLGEHKDHYPFVPPSSISIAAATCLPENIVRTFCKLPATLLGNSAYQDLQDLARERFKTFLQKRRGAPSAAHPEYSLWCLLAGGRSVCKSSEEFDTFPMDFEKLAFLCRLTRYLAGQKHEGHALRFAFLLGFRHEQVLGQLEGWFEDFDMEPTWPFATSEENAAQEVKARFSDFNQRHNDVGRGNEKIVAKWILANALLLQRWDVALFFETRKEFERFPELSRVIRLCNRDGLNKKLGAYPSNEFELQQLLQRVTQRPEMAGTAAVLISDRGAKLIVNGKVYLFRYLGSEDAERLVPVVEGFSPVAETFEDALQCELDRLDQFVDGPSSIPKDLPRRIRELAEALVALGHGALIAVRATAESPDLGMPPLAPVWKVKREETIEALSQDMLAFALAAALDGATEILVCRNTGLSTEGQIRTVVRFRSYVDQPFTPWERSVPGEVIVPLLERGQWNSSEADWGDLMTFGTRHRSAMALSLRDDVVVVTVSADGPVRLWRKGKPIVKVMFKP